MPGGLANGWATVPDKPQITIEVERRLANFKLDVQFQLKSGLTAFFGRSGAGKTSLINLIAGLDQPDHGHISIGSQILYDSDQNIHLAPEKRRIGYVFQDGRLFPHLSVHNNLIYARRFMDQKLNPETYDNIVQLLDIPGLLERRPGTLSGGEKQRVAIGRALLADPQLLIMDEPLAALDGGRKAEILPFLENLRDQLTTPILYVSHTMEEVIRLADNLVVMDGGRAVAHGDVETVMSRLDLSPLTGRYEAGAVFQVHIEEHDRAYRLTRLQLAGQTLWVPGIDRPIGTNLRIRIRARDVSISRQKPQATSILNVFAATVREIVRDQGPHCEILLDIGRPLIARITRKSVDELDLHAGQKVYASVKAAAIDRRSLGLNPTN